VTKQFITHWATKAYEYTTLQTQYNKNSGYMPMVGHISEVRMVAACVTLEKVTSHQQRITSPLSNNVSQHFH